jgi:hypothetical protein
MRLEEQAYINNEHRLEMAQAEIVKLQERVAFAEQARDNACALRDEARERAKKRGQVAGKLIAQLHDLVVAVSKRADKPTQDWAQELLDVLLAKSELAETPPTTEPPCGP